MIPTGSGDFLDVWSVLGYESSPYTTQAILPTEEMRKFFVGRAPELEASLSRLINGVRVLALEGDYGVGKTSLAAAIQVDAAKLARDGHQVFLPGIRSLGFTGGTTPEEFRRDVVFAVLETLLDREEFLRELGHKLSGARRLRRRLEELELTTRSWSFSHLFGLGGQSSANQTDEFVSKVLPRTMQMWLDQVFPTPGTGGLILHLDNLEDAAGVSQARGLIETLRDELFSSHQLRWIVSGADGFVFEALSGSKLAGVVGDPITVRPMSDSDVVRVVSRRTELLKTREDAIPPVSRMAFDSAYKWTGRNLRYALALAEKYCTGVLASSPGLAGQDTEFFRFLADRARSAFLEPLGAADSRVLLKIVEDFDGRCTPSDYAAFGYKKMPAFIARAKSLATADLVSYQMDRDDGRRRVVAVSSKGRLWALGAALSTRLDV